MQTGSLYLIDGSSYIFRAYYAIRQNLSNSKGMPTNALYGFVHMLHKVIKEEAPDYLAVVFDTGGKNFRHHIFPDYKAHREAPPEDLQKQFPYFEPLARAYGVACLKKEGVEADDVIGTLARRAEDAGFQRIVIVSGDKDMMQLISPRVSMLDTMKEKIITENEVVEKFGVPPSRVIDVMALIGDSSDNVPGVSGVGPKTAAELMRKFTSLDDLYANLERVEKAKLREKLALEKESAFLSRRLVTIDTAVPLECELADLKPRDADMPRLTGLLRELEFSSLLQDAETGPPVAHKTEKKYQAILTEDGARRVLAQLRAAGEFAVDLETTSPRPMRAAIVGMSFSCQDHEACYIPLAHSYDGAPPQLDKGAALEMFRPLLEDPAIRKFGHNIKYDKIVFRREGIDLRGVAFDSMLASYVLNPSKHNHNMDDLALEYLGHKTITYEDVTGKGNKQISFAQVSIEHATRYAAEDADVTWLFAKKLRPLLNDEAARLYDDVELPLVDVLADMEMRGVFVDADCLAGVASIIGRELQRLEAEIYAAAGETFAINSPKQLGVILFEKLKLPAVKKTKTGYSTDISVLEELAAEHELPDKVLNWRQLAKLKNTYVDVLPEEIDPRTGRVHTSFNQTVTATGRLSSSDPNLQNIPARSEIGREIRRAFAGQNGNMLLSADYSQIELRILAHLAEDAALIRAFKQGEDIHSRTAAEILGRPITRIDAEARRMAKAVNFGIVYGLSAFGLSRQLKINPRQAKEYIEQYFNLYHGVKRYMEETVAAARRLGYSETLLRRRRYLPDLNSANKQVRAAAERIAINSPVQGSAADLIKLAMIRLHRALAQDFESRMVLQVHDELLFECVPSERERMQALVKREMETVAELRVPLTVDMGWGKNWAEAH